MDTNQPQRPAWQTDELAEEWIEPDGDQQTRTDSQKFSTGGTRSSFNFRTSINFATTNEQGSSRDDLPQEAAGTILIREDVPDVPLLHKAKAGMKGIFSPLALEKMFEPPSPPNASTSLENTPPISPIPPPQSRLNTAPLKPSKLSQVIGRSFLQEDSVQEGNDGDSTRDMLNDGTGEQKLGSGCQFTFAVPLLGVAPSPLPSSSELLANMPPSSQPLAQSTPIPPPQSQLHQQPPGTDPRLRLFQFQYDTFTREHLSAIVDSIAVNTTPSGNGSSMAARTDAVESPDDHDAGHSYAHRRSTKRLKLSPPEVVSRDCDVEAGISGEQRPATVNIEAPLRQSQVKDYVGESRSLMRQIRQARDVSVMSIMTELPPENAEDAPSKNVYARRCLLHIPDYDTVGRPPSSLSTSTSRSGGTKESKYSSQVFKRQAADLMAQIRNDLKFNKRIFSDCTEKSVALSRIPSEKEDETRSGTQQLLRPSPISDSNSREATKRRYEDEQSQEEKENVPVAFHSHKDSLVTMAKKRASPQRALRRLNMGHGSNHEIRVEQSFGSVVIANMSHIPESYPLASQYEFPSVHSFHSDVYRNTRVRSPNPTFLAPPNGVSIIRSEAGQDHNGHRNDDLNRFVSSSTTATVTTGTTLTGSFVKHPGPLHNPMKMVQIKPGDVPGLGDRVGRMVFDRVVMRWVQERNGQQEGTDRTFSMGTDMVSMVSNHTEVEMEVESEDPFRDIDSLTGESGSRSRLHSRAGESNHDDDDNIVDGADGAGEADMVLTDVETEIDSETDARDQGNDSDREVSTFSFSDPATGVVHVMTGIGDDMDETSDSEDEVEFEYDEEDVDTEEELSNAAASMSLAYHVVEAGNAPIPEPASPPRRNVMRDAAHRSSHSPPLRTPVPAEKRIVQPPRSALKSASVTPITIRKPGQKHRRSVSFSDGRRDGKILGLESADRTAQPDMIMRTPVIKVNGNVTTAEDAGKAVVPSARSNRIAQMLEGLEEQSSDDSPLKGSQTEKRQIIQRAQSLLETPGPHPSKVKNVSSRPFARSPTVRAQQSQSPRNTSARANATFLTECSFAVAHDRLVQVITDIQPFEPHWETLSSVDLSGKKIDSVARLKEFLPYLDSLRLDENLLAWLSGVPASVRTLSVSSNALTSLTSFAHLLNLENLDISRNDINSLQQLACLRHLRELRADGNQIGSLDGLENLDGLVKVSLQGNDLRKVDLTVCRWNRLEMLDLSHNRLKDFLGLNSLSSLIVLNLENNWLRGLDAGSHPRTLNTRSDHGPKSQPPYTSAAALSKLRVLRLSNNRLETLDVAQCPCLRTLYVDNNCLANKKDDGNRRIMNLDSLAKLENFSARNQSGGGAREGGLYLDSKDLRDAKRLYLSGNPHPFPLPGDPLSSAAHLACFNLVYLELAACRLTSLPPHFSSLTPNLRVLNLNYNFLDTDDVVRGLSGLSRLRKLTIVGGRMRGTKGLLRTLTGMREIEMLDFRMNPCTLGWYLPLLVNDVPAALQPSESKSATTAAMAKVAVEDFGDHNKRDVKYTQKAGATVAELDAEGVSRSRRLPDLAKTTWETLDAQFRKGLPDELYGGRLAYRGMVMRACPRVQVLDGVRVTERERKKAEGLLKGVLGKAAGKPSRADEVGGDSKKMEAREGRK